jgi:hypothetical protein
VVVTVVVVAHVLLASIFIAIVLSVVTPPLYRARVSSRSSSWARYSATRSPAWLRRLSFMGAFSSGQGDLAARSGQILRELGRPNH